MGVDQAEIDAARSHKRVGTRSTPRADAVRARRLGYHAEAARICGEALDGGARDPRLVVERMRAQLAAGRPLDARTTGQRHGHVAEACALERRRLALYDAWALLLNSGDNAAAADAADRALAGVGSSGLSTLDVAELQALHARVRSGADRLGEPALAARRMPTADLGETAHRLLAAGRTDEGLDALAAWAEQQPEPGEAHGRTYAQARRRRRPAMAAQALLDRVNAALAAVRVADGPAIEADLARAESLFTAAGHRTGGVDVARLRALAAIHLRHAPLDQLAATVDAYRRLDHPKGELQTLLDLSSLAHQRGELGLARGARDALVARAGAVGMGLLRDGGLLADVDLLLRAGDHAAARDLCEDAIALSPGPLQTARFEQMLATALAFVGDAAGAIERGRSALARFVDAGSEGEASNAAVKLAGDHMAGGDAAGMKRARDLLQEWRVRDLARGDAAAAAFKTELEIDLALREIAGTAPGADAGPALREADAQIAQAEVFAATRLDGVEAAKRLGSLQQMRARLATMRNDEAAMEAGQRRARDIFRAAGLAYESANCSYLLGCLQLNHANRTLQPHFGAAERELNDALAYYAEAGMRDQAASTRHKLALLWSNAAPRVNDGLAAQLDAAALHQLDLGEADLDLLRRSFWSPDLWQAREGKRALARKTEPLTALAIGIALRQGSSEVAWNWVQRSKARALSDLLGGRVELAETVRDALAGRPELLALVLREQAVSDGLASAGASARPPLRAELAEVHARMGEAPELADYLEARTGRAPDREDVGRMLAAAGRAAVAIDWFAVGDRLFLATVRAGAPPGIVALEIGLGEVARFVAANLDAHSFRATLREAPELLRALDPLIAPLARLSEPGDALILCPTGPIFAVPLHALELGGMALVERNPVVLAPSLGALRSCMARPGTRRTGDVAVFGDPQRDREPAADVARAVAAIFGVEPLLSQAVSGARFAAALTGADLVHFQGHALHDAADALRSRLLLADGESFDTARLLRTRLRARTIVLGACESAASAADAGDELLGLIPGFLVAGAARVVAALWRVQDKVAAAFMREFYARALGPNALPLADAWQGAVLALRADPAFAAPLFWAPFVLYGSGWETLHDR